MRCPTCHAKQHAAVDHCRRCNTDISILFKIERHARDYVYLAIIYLVNRQPLYALASLQQALMFDKGVLRAF